MVTIAPSAATPEKIWDAPWLPMPALMRAPPSSECPGAGGGPQYQFAFLLGRCETASGRTGRDDEIVVGNVLVDCAVLGVHADSVW
ncbi:hypothetical protein [Rhodococcus tibetensis]|uniref:Uncharacterized protein n=1 Tax=Rhodococcus tibetensis TaxID=2965064 RepID=A0ABT1QFI6_9NOCA|nr:hypothetical protein [Rhodococcus sp. FXJ9.536]MCQ4121041.1 hypothetical protein [Rhodococcus sp. FXJ9.536]